jgi:arabinan endo-1,5-alpha-L-arabinosidase
MITTVRSLRSVHPRRLLTALTAAGAALVLALSGPATVAQSAPARTYTNPVSESFADTFADPSIIHAKDGWWYAYSTADPLRAGDEPGIMHIARTRDFVTWDYQGTVFNADNRPAWATSTSGLWAPDIRYVNGRYVLYFTVTDTTLNPGDDSAIGVATSPSPTGPWQPTAAPVVAPRPGNGGFLWTFDPAGFTDVDGQRYLYYGSYNGGLWVTRVAEDGLTAVGAATMVAIDNRYEGAYVVRHGSWYYLMGSAANCCAGPTTGYSVFSGRSKSPLGPFRDADGISLLASAVGGTTLVTQNGNRWIGAGHHAIATDNSGRDYLVYHALDRNNAWLNEPFGITRRPMLMDRIDWVDGWPRVRAGAGPSDSPQPAPVVGSSLGITPADPARAGFRRLSEGPRDPQAGATARLRGTARTVQALGADRVRVRLDLRATKSFELTLGRQSQQVRVTVDPTRDRLVLRTASGRRVQTDTSSLRDGAATWRTLTVEVDGARVVAQVSESDLNDPLAEVRLHSPGLALRSAPVQLSSANALLDNVSVRPPATEAAHLVAVPKAGQLLAAEEFDGPLSSAWTRVRPEASTTTVSRGRLNWPVEGTDLTGGSNNAGVLLHSTPTGTYIAETKLTLDLGENTVRNYQQAGLVAYVNDNDFARLSSVAIWNTRQTEFGRELVVNTHGDTSYGGAVIGTPAPTVWLRLAHTRNAAGEHLYRAATSRDGRHWTWGAVWTFAADEQPRIGLVAHGGATPAVTAQFDYLRFYATRWPGNPG